MRTIVTHLRGNVVAYVALVVALGGTSYAAVRLPANSVGSKQLKANSVTSPKVRNGSLLVKDFKTGQLPRGAQGPRGNPGPQGAKGDTGAPGPFIDTVPSGKTMRGTWAIRGAAGSPADAAISFVFPLSSAPTAHYLGTFSGSTAECPGSVADPQAVPGHFCIYEGGQFNVRPGDPLFCTPIGPSCGPVSGVSRFGTFLEAHGANTTQTFFAVGTWAATAP